MTNLLSRAARHLVQSPRLGLSMLGATILGCASFAAMSLSEPSTGAADAPAADASAEVAPAALTEAPAPSPARSAYFPNAKLTGPVLDGVRYQPVEKPGIILIVTDTLRPDHLGAYGYPSDTSPFFDSLAQAGVAFFNHFSNSSWTKTSMASLLTGLFPGRHGVLEVNSRLAPSYVTLAEAFKAAGFKTGAVIANQIVGTRYGLAQGFDFLAEPRTHFDNEAPHAGRALASAARWLQEVKDEPFFLMVLLFDAHDPYYPPAPLREKYCANCGNDLITTPEREYRSHAPTAKQVADMKALYDGEIRSISNHLTGFYDVTRKLGILDRTTWAVVSDHGEAFGEHGVFEHAFHMWDEVVRTPFILQGAGVRSTGVVHTPTSHVDVFPTLLRVAGLIPPSGLQGQSLVRREGEPGLDPDRILVTEVEMYGIHRLTMRDRSRKLVYHAPLKTETFSRFYRNPDVYPSVAKGTSRWEFFDLEQDPFEMSNLHPDPERAPEADYLMRAMEVYRRTGGIEFEVPPELSEEVLDDLRSLGYVH